MSQFQVNRKNYLESRIVEDNIAETQNPNGLAANEVLVKIDKFALTANNITYAVVGEQIGYWKFFPAQASQEQQKDEQWGILPVWGFADVIASNHADVPVKERLFGYFPPATHLRLIPSKVGETSWIDASEHRAQLPAGYNVYRRVMSEPNYHPDFENDRMLLFPLHITSYALYDFFQEKRWFDAKQVVILSASSKTSTGLAYGIQADENAPTCIALTSAGNADMVAGLNIYDQTFSYQDLAQIDASLKTVIVDMSGNGTLLSDLHKHLGDNMMFCSNVGLTHWHDSAKGPDFIDSRSEFFFAPSQIQKRLKEWGPQVFEQKSRDYLMMTMTKSREWLTQTQIDGLTGMQDIFEDMCEGRVPPNKGLVIQL